MVEDPPADKPDLEDQDATQASGRRSGKPNPWARRKARRALLQALYQWQMTGCDLATLKTQFDEDASALVKADREFFHEMLGGVVRAAEALDELYRAYLDRELDQVERALLRLGCFELQYRIDVPYRVVIDEYVELAKTFGAEASHKYINGILDRVAADLRQVERGAS